MDLENKAIGFQFEPERSMPMIKDSTKIVVMKERDMFDRKDCDLSVLCKCRGCSTMKTEKECLCCQDVEVVCDFNLEGIFVLSQAIILSEVTRNLMISVSICFCNQMWFQKPCHM